jgi:hypothetical protein
MQALETQKRKARTWYMLEDDSNIIYFDNVSNKGYDKKTYSKLKLNKLKIMGGPIPIYIPLRTWFKEAFIKVSMCAPTKEVSKETS